MAVGILCVLVEVTVLDIVLAVEYEPPSFCAFVHHCRAFVLALRWRCPRGHSCRHSREARPVTEKESRRRAMYLLRKMEAEDRERERILGASRAKRDNEFLVTCGIAPVTFDQGQIVALERITQ